MKLYKARVGDKIIIKSLDGLKNFNLAPEKFSLRIGEMYKIEDLSNGVILRRGGRLIALGKELLNVIEVNIESRNRR